MQPEDALSSQYGDSQVNLPNQTSIPVVTTALSVTTDESQENNPQPTFYNGALRTTEGIFENSLGPSGRYIESMATPD